MSLIQFRPATHGWDVVKGNEVIGNVTKGPRGLVLTIEVGGLDYRETNQVASFMSGEEDEMERARR